MKYSITKYKFEDVELFNITTTFDDVTFTNFTGEVGNPNYDQFLADTGLTDKKVQALTPNKWYDFPKES